METITMNPYDILVALRNSPLDGYSGRPVLSMEGTSWRIDGVNELGETWVRPTPLGVEVNLPLGKCNTDILGKVITLLVICNGLTGKMSIYRVAPDEVPTVGYSVSVPALTGEYAGLIRDEYLALLDRIGALDVLEDEFNADRFNEMFSDDGNGNGGGSSDNNNNNKGGSN